MELNSDDLKRKQEWQAVKEKLEFDLQKTFTEAQDVHDPGNPFIPRQDVHSSSDTDISLYRMFH